MNAAFDRVLVTGVTGQVGRALVEQLGVHRCIAASRAVLPLDFPEALESRLDYFRPRAIINAGAYTAVDLAESPEEAIFVQAINEQSPERLARWCARNRVPLVHFSTDYVFDGSGTEARHEACPTAPLNEYGKSKLAGEQAILESGCFALIFRTSWVYDHQGKNFFRTMLRLGSEKEELKVVSDQIGAPTFAPQLAHAAISALERALEQQESSGQFPTGIYHLCHSGETSWWGFAQEIFEQAQRRAVELKVQRLLKVATTEYPSAARRPLNSRLDCQKVKEVLQISLPDWRVGLDECFDRWLEERLKDGAKK
ncbi:MAG: hypothetical protein RJB38_2087 [Pseudomonadota bacterium]|jgi:dTDP-4-dehydrorhamnose reductase